MKVGENDLVNARDYGYGYWIRYTTRHPVHMMSGKN
jgi:hypothetical protein